MKKFQVYVECVKTEVYEVEAEDRAAAVGNYPEGELLEVIGEEFRITQVLDMTPENSTHFEVHTYTLCDGWVNTWSCTNEFGAFVPETFNTFCEAKKALDDYLEEIRQEIEYGEREETNGYDLDDFKIVRVDVIDGKVFVRDVEFNTNG